MTHSTDSMTYDRWTRMTPRERDAARDTSDLHPQLIAFKGKQVEVTYAAPHYPVCTGNTEAAFRADPIDGLVTRERFQVGQSTGWKPATLALFNRRSMGGDAISRSVRFASVREV